MTITEEHYRIEYFRKPSKAAKDQTPKRVTGDYPLPEEKLGFAYLKARIFRPRNCFFRILDNSGKLVFDSRRPDPGIKKKVRELFEDAPDMVAWRAKGRPGN